jgi:hypothetical protein
MSIEQFALNAAVVFWISWKASGALIRFAFGSRRDERPYNLAPEWPLVRLQARPSLRLIAGRWI